MKIPIDVTFLHILARLDIRSGSFDNLILTYTGIMINSYGNIWRNSVLQCLKKEKSMDG